MRDRRSAAAIVAVVALVLLVAAVGPGKARAQKKDIPPPKTTRLTIVVTGGDTNKAVAEASVYLRYVAVTGKHGKEQKFELNLKTNQEGETHSPEIPQGKVLIQIVAENWKTFGEYFDLQEDDQTVQIHLDRPTTKWY
jgi:hypothetical protein